MTKFQGIRNYVWVLMGKHGWTGGKLNFCDAMNLLASFLYAGAENFHGSAVRGMFLNFRDYVWDRMGHGLGLFDGEITYCDFMNLAYSIMSIADSELTPRSEN